ncbi:MAG TPA: glycoside hydrolase family 95 protein, partial [Puia sp.]|nr:glycoside hydrolase family 95 protein [Puia sp.]
GTYPDLLDAHPPFQIDGNFGGTAGMAEMLIQSHLGEIHLLPALPFAWKEGEVKGLCARGGFRVDIRWKDHQLTSASITALQSGLCRIRTAFPVRLTDRRASIVSSGGYLLSFQAVIGHVYDLTAL